MNAVIDSLQKSAQASELDHTNTSPSLFLALSVLEVAVTQCIAYCFGWRWQLAEERLVLNAQLLNTLVRRHRRRRAGEDGGQGPGKCARAT